MVGLIIPQLLSAQVVRDASSCVHWNLGIVSFYTGSVKVDVYDDVTGEHVGSYTESCGNTTWFAGIFD